MRNRWSVLAAGTIAQAASSGTLLGIAILLPALRDRYDLSLGEAGVLVAAPGIGGTLSFLAWGLAVDRFGERRVAPLGLFVAAGALAAASAADSFTAVAAWLGVVGLAGASINAASGRIVMSWFDASQRGLALGIRQSAIPVGGVAAAVALPLVAAAGGARWGLLTLALASVAGGVLAALLYEGPVRTAGDAELARPLRDRRLWRLLAAAVLLIFPQTAVFGFTVLFLHDARGLSPAAAAHVFAVVQLLGIVARIVAGRWSDRVRSRVGPLRAIAAVAAVLTVATGAAAGAPLAVLLPALVASGVASMSWNGLAFAATAELAGRARSGAALGMQQTALAAAGFALPLVFAGVAGGLGWGWAWALTASGPAAAALVLRGLRA